MCLLVASTEHPEFPLILLSNRDEYFARPTALASFSTVRPGVRLLAPYDLARPEHGTWIGLTTSGRLAVLLNYNDPDGCVRVASQSRGIIPLKFLESELPPSAWQETFCADYAKELRDVGGFTLVFGDLRQPTEQCTIDGLHIMSNRGLAGKVLCGNSVERTFGVSNSLYSEPWPKVKLAERLLHETIERAVESNMGLGELVECGFEILTHDTYCPPTSLENVQASVRATIFVPPLKRPLTDAHLGTTDDYYGTRTQTIVVADRKGHMRYFERDLRISNNFQGTDENARQNFHFQIVKENTPHH